MGDLPNSRGRALAEGFWQHGQDALLASYADRYVADLPGIWSRRPLDQAAILTRLLFPATLVEASVLDRTAALVTDDAVPGQRRMVLESRDDLARALRSRALA